MWIFTSPIPVWGFAGKRSLLSLHGPMLVWAPPPYPWVTRQTRPSAARRVSLSSSSASPHCWYHSLYNLKQPHPDRFARARKLNNGEKREKMCEKREKMCEKREKMCEFVNVWKNMWKTWKTWKKCVKNWKTWKKCVKNVKNVKNVEKKKLDFKLIHN